MKSNNIIQIITNCFEPSPEIKAAHFFADANVTSKQLTEDKQLNKIPEAWKIKVINALRDIEIRKLSKE